MTFRRLSVLKFGLAIEALTFVVSAFGANLLTSFFEAPLWIYLVVAIAATILFLGVRWLFSKPQRVALLAHDTMVDTLADAAMSYGVADVYNMQRLHDQNRRNHDTAVTIKNANTMSLAANSGASYLSVGLQRHWPAVRLRLLERVPFRVILLDPASGERALRNSINVVGERDDNKLPLGDIIRASNEFHNLEIRFADRGMSCSVFITEDEAYFDPYHLAEDGGRISNRFMCWKMKKTDVTEGISNYEMVRRHFDALWDASTPLEDWIANNSERVDALPKVQT
ncbi:hypothetical protein [uncultured Cohaesibacter sp.]|uniref:hypothetical protein n=1 Tax=uncultured Cohaesibacter sp. TaxID=1002546 RepID=UPI0029C86069|nr:hypothetical protein [uncultured Cohaesibacter sp.]